MVEREKVAHGGSTAHQECLVSTYNIAFYFSIADKSTTTVSTKVDTSEIPASAPTKNWYKKPMIIMGFSIGGFFVFVFVLLILAILSRKWKRKVNVAIDYQAPSPLAAMPGSFVNSLPTTSEGGVVQDLEMEDLKNVLR